MKPKASRVPRWSKSLAAVFALAAVTLFAGVACGAVGQTGSGGVLELVPDTVAGVQVFDVREILGGDAPSDFEDLLDFPQVLEGLKKWGILGVDVRTLVVAASGSGEEVNFLQGEFDFDGIREALDEAGREDEDYRGYELWEGYPAVALLEDDGHVILGGPVEVKAVLKSLARDQGLLLQHGEDPLKRAMDRAGTGLVAWSDRDCGSLDLSGCDATAFAASAGDEFSVEMVDAYVFSSERVAAAAVRDLDDFYERWGDAVDSLVYEVNSDGEFVVVKASVDEDEFASALFAAAMVVQSGEDNGTGGNPPVRSEVVREVYVEKTAPVRSEVVREVYVEKTAPVRSEVVREVYVEKTAPVRSEGRGVPLGTAARVADWEITVLSVVSDATDAGSGRFHGPPGEGRQYFMATLRATYVGEGSESLGEISVSLVGGSRVAYKYDKYVTSCSVGEDHDHLPFDRELFSGGEIVGSLCWRVPSSEVDSLEMVFESYMLERPILFDLT